MKTPITKFLFGAVCVLSLYSQLSFATQPGCSINRTGDLIHVISKDNDGVVHDVKWENRMRGTFASNVGQSDKNGNIYSVYKKTLNGKSKLSFRKSSTAVWLCEANHLRLPSKKEAEALLNCFEQETSEKMFEYTNQYRTDKELWISNKLTPDGKIDLREQFNNVPFGDDKSFWTSNYLIKYPQTAYAFGGDGTALAAAPRKTRYIENNLNVICVAQ